VLATAALFLQLTAVAQAALSPARPDTAAPLMRPSIEAPVLLLSPAPADSDSARAVSPVNGAHIVLAPLDTPTRRPRAIEVSDWYNRRLVIHRWASYVTLPLFAAQYELGRNLLYDSRPTQSLRTTHLVVASTIGGLFVVNTVTGVWNLWDSRDATEGRTLRYVHAALMLGADAGFTATGIAGRHATKTGLGRERHKRIALASIGLSTVGTVLMWVKNR
jgi:hypothetical protein